MRVNIHEIVNGKIKLDNIIDDLYYKIRQQRQELKPLLVNKVTTISATTNRARRKGLIIKYIKFSVMICFAVLIGIEFVVKQNTSAITSQLHSISQTLVNFHGN